MLDKRVGAALSRDLEAEADRATEEAWEKSARKRGRKLAAERERSRLEWFKHLRAVYEGRAREYAELIQETEETY